MKRVVALIAVGALLLTTIGTALVLAISLLDDSSGEAPRSSVAPSPTPTDPSVTEAPDPALQRFYDQSIAWVPCEDNDDHDCGTLEVPVDYAEPDGETIDLAVLRVPASGDRQASLVVNPGGPGAPGTTYAGYEGLAWREPLLQAFDIVGFDPRGTGGSAPVDCLSDEEVDDFVAADPAPDTVEEVAETEVTIENFGTGCVEGSGPVVGHVTTIEAARDMDVLRAALGDPTLSYFGASYGTKLGATYAELFPDRVGRLVLDGAVDVDLGFKQMALDQAAGFETALRAYVQNCLDSTDNCFLGDTVDEGLGTIKTLLDDVDAAPLPAGERQLEVGNAFYGLVTPLYNRDYWVLLSMALSSALEGNGAALMELSDAYSSRAPGGGYLNNSMEAIYAINCLDDPSAVDPQDVPELFDDFDEASPTLGRVFAWGLAACDGIQVTSSEEPLDIRGEGADPILVLGTTRDPATPLKWAESLADDLESGVLVRRDGDGHTAYNTDNACVDAIVEDYLIDGVVPADGTDC